MDRSASLNRLAELLRLQRMAPDAEPFLDLMSDGFIWSDENLKGLSAEESGKLRAIFRFRTGLITRLPDLRAENLWIELRKLCPEWIGFDPSRCSPNENLAALYERSKKRRPLESLERMERLWRKSSAGTVTQAKQQSVAITLLLRARDAVNVASGELEELDAAFHDSIERDEPEAALQALERIAENVPCRGGFWRDMERTASALQLKDRAKYFRNRFLSTKPGH